MKTWNTPGALFRLSEWQNVAIELPHRVVPDTILENAGKIRLMENITLASNPIEPASADEAQRIEAARCDPAAFAALYHRYVTPVYRYLYQWTGNVKEAEDLTSQVFTEALEGLARYRERGQFAAWLFSIARRKAISAYRRRRPEISLEAAEELPAPTGDLLEQVAEQEQIAQMTTILAGLTEDQRELLRLRFSARLPYADIAALLGSSEAAVKMAVHRLLRKMYEQWETI